MLTIFTLEYDWEYPATVPVFSSIDDFRAPVIYQLFEKEFGDTVMVIRGTLDIEYMRHQTTFYFSNSQLRKHCAHCNTTL